MLKYLFSRYLFSGLFILRSIPVYCSYDKVYMGHEAKYEHSTCSQLYKKSIGGRISGLVRPYERQLNCTVNIEAPLGTKIDINIHSMDFVTADPSGCYSVKLLVYDGDSFESSNIIPQFPSGLCNESIPSQGLHTRSNVLSVRFEVIGTSVEVSFEAVYTSYKTFDDGSCHFCSNNNEMCIPEELVCDGLQNCADSSEEVNCETDNPKEESTSSATWIIIGVVIGFALVVAAVTVFILVYKRHLAKDTDAPTPPEPVYYEAEFGPSPSHWLQPPPVATGAVTPSPVGGNGGPPNANYAHGSADACPLPDQPPTYERSLQDAADEELAVKRALAEDREN